jgi:hypothetical protein
MNKSEFTPDRAKKHNWRYFRGLTDDHKGIITFIIELNAGLGWFNYNGCWTRMQRKNAKNDRTTVLLSTDQGL